MKKLVIGLSLAAALASSNVLAQTETAGGVTAGNLTVGGFAVSIPGAVFTAVAIGAGASISSNGSAPAREVIPPPVQPPVEPPVESCNGDDALVDGVCINNSVTTTVTGTGTMTSTTTVPVVTTYLPSVSS